MPLVLAVEPDRRQAMHLTQIVRQRVGAELILAETTELALASIGNRVPDLILVPALLSPQDDAALAAALRVIASAAHVQMLTTPLLASAQPAHKKGVLAVFRRSKEKASPDGCDPAEFAQQISSYLQSAAEERAAAEYAMADAPVFDSVSEAAAAPVEHAVDEFSTFETPQAAEPVAAVETVAEPEAIEPIEAAEPIREILEAAPTPIFLAPEPVHAHEPEPIVALELEPAAEIEPEPLPAMEPEPVVAFEPEPAIAFETEPVFASETEPVASSEEEPLAVREPELVLQSDEPLAAFESEDEATAIEAEPIIEIEIEPEPMAALESTAINFELVTDDDERFDITETEDVSEIFELEAPALHAVEDAELAPIELVADAAEVEDAAEFVPERVEFHDPLREFAAGIEALSTAHTARVERAPVEPQGPFEFDDFFPKREPVEPSPLGAWRSWIALEGMVAEVAEAPVPAHVVERAVERASEQPGWVQLVESLRIDVERRRTEQRPPVAAAPTRPPSSRPVQDEWGLFDPTQCGFAALLAKLDEITTTGDSRPRPSA